MPETVSGLNILLAACRYYVAHKNCTLQDACNVYINRYKSRTNLNPNNMRKFIHDGYLESEDEKLHKLVLTKIDYNNILVSGKNTYRKHINTRFNGDIELHNKTMLEACGYYSDNENISTDKAAEKYNISKGKLHYFIRNYLEAMDEDLYNRCVDRCNYNKEHRLERISIVNSTRFHMPMNQKFKELGSDVGKYNKYMVEACASYVNDDGSSLVKTGIKYDIKSYNLRSFIYKDLESLNSDLYKRAVSKLNRNNKHLR